MPFEIKPVDVSRSGHTYADRRYGIFRLKPGNDFLRKSTGELVGEPFYKSPLTAVSTAKRWMEYRGEKPYVIRQGSVSMGTTRLLVLSRGSA